MPTPLTPKAHDPLPPLTEAQRILIQDARNRIAKPENWTQNQLASTSQGWPVSPTSASANCWCAVGTIYKSTADSKSVSNYVLDRVNQVIAVVMDDDRTHITHINDDELADAQLPEQLRPLTPHQRVLFIFDEVLKT